MDRRQTDNQTGPITWNPLLAELVQKGEKIQGFDQDFEKTPLEP